MSQIFDSGSLEQPRRFKIKASSQRGGQFVEAAVNVVETRSENSGILTTETRKLVYRHNKQRAVKTKSHPRTHTGTGAV